MYKTILTVALGMGATLAINGTAMAATGTVDKKQAAPPPPKIHVVASGDSLSSIAEAEHLDSWRPLWNVNPDISNPDLVFEGEKVIVPVGPTTDRSLPEGVVSSPLTTNTSTPVASSGNNVRAAAPANYADGAGGLLARIRAREAGGNYATNTGNGYYGAYQFSLGTWRGVGGTGLPSDASPAEQDMRAQMLISARGCSPWPNTCY